MGSYVRWGILCYMIRWTYHFPAPQWVLKLAEQAQAGGHNSPILLFCSALLQAGFNLAFWEKGVVGEGESDVVNDILTIPLHNHIANVATRGDIPTIERRVLLGDPGKGQISVFKATKIAQQGQAPGLRIDHHHPCHRIDIRR